MEKTYGVFVSSIQAVATVGFCAATIVALQLAAAGGSDLPAGRALPGAQDAFVPAGHSPQGVPLVIAATRATPRPGIASRIPA